MKLFLADDLNGTCYYINANDQQHARDLLKVGYGIFSQTFDRKVKMKKFNFSEISESGIINKETY